MIAHILKLVWNRKRWNALILMEIFLSFLVLFSLAVVAVTLYAYRQAPLGFDPDDVQLLEIDYPAGSTSEDNMAGTLETMNAIDAFLKNQPEISAHALMNTPPYVDFNWTDRLVVDGRRVLSNLSLTSVGLRDALDLEVAAGRWLEERDATREGPTAMAVNRRLAEALFPGEDPVGKQFANGEDAYRIVGVVEHFRMEGELRKPRNFAFLPLVMDDKVGWLPSCVVVETHQSVGAPFEERLIDGLSRIAPGWSFKIEAFPKLRAKYFQQQTRDLKIMAVLALFLLIMVAMGLIGVLWQHVTRRTVELGVRRAKGATRRAIYAQVTGEFLAVASFALLLGLAAVLQIPIVGLFKHADFSILATAFLLAGLVIYLLTALAAAYPGWLATRTSPADALHYE